MFISCTLPLQTPLIKDHFTHYYVDQNKQTEYHTFPLIRFAMQQNKKKAGRFDLSNEIKYIRKMIVSYQKWKK